MQVERSGDDVQPHRGIGHVDHIVGIRADTTREKVGEIRLREALDQASQTSERLGEIATLRAIGVSRATIVRQVLAEGTALTTAGAALGIAARRAAARTAAANALGSGTPRPS